MANAEWIPGNLVGTTSRAKSEFVIQDSESGSFRNPNSAFRNCVQGSRTIFPNWARSSIKRWAWAHSARGSVRSTTARSFPSAM